LGHNRPWSWSAVKDFTQGRAGDEECGEDGIISFFLLPLNVPEAVKEGQKVTTDSSGILAIS